MPSQRFLGSEASSVLDLQNGSSETIAPPPVTESSAHILPSQTLPLPANAEAVDDNQGPSSGLHDVVKKTDFWFNIQLSQLEKYAVDMAVAWANAGIPRQDAPLDGELPIETTLKARAQETFREWIARVKRKVQDAIQSASNDAGVSCLCWKWRKRSSGKIAERTYEERTEALQRRRESSDLEAASFGPGASLGPV